MTNEWSDYLGEGGVRPITSIALFPEPEQPLTAEDLDRMERDRFCWLMGVYSTDPYNLFLVWKDENFVMDERKALGKISLKSFYINSVGLGLLLLRREVRHLYYLHKLRDALRLRLREGQRVLFFGPTSGAEMEAIYNAGGRPVLVSDDEASRWQHICETRLIDSRVPFDTCLMGEVGSQPPAHYAVFSSWLPDPVRAVKLAYTAVGKYGFLFFPSTNLSLGHEVKRLALRPVDTFETAVGVAFKPPAHSPKETQACS